MGGSSKKYQRNGVNPVRFKQVELSEEHGHSSALFCKRGPCHICSKSDDINDPSLWLVCISENGDGDNCGLSCHLDCALQPGITGVGSGYLVDQDGEYHCTCGNVSSTLGCLKIQLTIAKETSNLNILRARISLSHRILEGTYKFKEIYEIIQKAREKLEMEVQPVSEVSAKLPKKRGIVPMHPVAGEVQELCDLAIQKVDERLYALTINNLYTRACSFEDITSSSVVVVLNDAIAASDLEGIKLWYCKTCEVKYPEEPAHIFPKTQTRMLVPNLQAATEYSFRIATRSLTGDVALFEAKCCTKSKHPVHVFDLNAVPDPNDELATPLFNSSAGEEFRQPERFGVTEYGAAHLDIEKGHSRPEVTGVSTDGIVPAVNFEEEPPENSPLISKKETSENRSMSWDEKSQNCVKLIRKLELDGHISEEFRMKFLTWFSVRSTEDEKKVVYTYIEAFVEDAHSLAGQLMHTFPVRALS